MDGSKIVCWKCGVSLAELLLPLFRTEECAHCRTDLHVCRMCRFYDTGVSNACREPIADPVSDKRRANFCGYLQLRQDPSKNHSDQDQTIVADDLNSLFGLGSAKAHQGDATTALNELFQASEGSDEKAD